MIVKGTGGDRAAALAMILGLIAIPLMGLILAVLAHPVPTCP